MSSTGGIHLSEEVFVHIVQMIISGYHWQHAAMLLATGDTGVLDEPVHFLEGRPVNPEDDSYYDLPGRSEEIATYTNIVNVLSCMGLDLAMHGLPLIGTCDWNDGMNMVGNQGQR